MILEKYSEFNLPGPKILITPKVYFYTAETSRGTF